MKGDWFEAPANSLAAGELASPEFMGGIAFRQDGQMPSGEGDTCTPQCGQVVISELIVTAALLAAPEEGHTRHYRG